MKKFYTIIAGMVVSAICCFSTQAQNYCLNFAGATQYVSVASNYGLTTANVSAECWVYLPSTSEQGTFINIGDAGTGYGIGVGSGSFDSPGNELIYINNLVSWQGTGTNIGTGWHHVAFTMDGSQNTNIYLDGKIVKSFTQTPYQPNNSCYIGSTIGTNRVLTNGKIDEVRVWNVARTQSEICANMYREIGAQANLVGYYKMSDGSGSTLSDNLNTGKNGTITGATWQASGVFAGPRNALDFNGTDENVTIPHHSTLDLSYVTLTAWINADTWPINYYDGTIIVKEYSVNGYGLRCGDGGKLNFFVYLGGVAYQVTSAALMSTGKWYHVAGVYNGSTVTIYIDGVSVGSLAATGTLNTYGVQVYIGGYGGRWFDGKIDECQLWSTALTESQIRENMITTRVGNETGLQAYYRMDYTTGTTLYDVTSNANHGTLSNMDNTNWVSSSAFNTWIGGESGTWSTAGNWSRNASPSATDNVGLYKYTLGNEATLSGTPTFNNLYFSSTASPTLSSNFTVNGNLVLGKSIGLNGQQITLGSSGKLVEGSNAFSGTTGSITTTRTLNNISAENVGGLGATITTSANLGSTAITRTHAPSSHPTGIKRIYQISPTTNTGLNATLVFNYLDSELNGQTEASLKLYKSTNGSLWNSQTGGIVNTTANTITLAGIDGFSYWTASSASYYLTGNAMDMDGISNYVSIPANAGLNNNQFTVEFWLKQKDQPQNYDGIVNKGREASDDWYVLALYGQLGAMFGIPGIGEIPYTVGDNAWHHYAGTYDGTTMSFYVDGILYETKTGSYTPSANGIVLGKYATNYLNGQMDELRIWNTARSVSSIRDNMCTALTGDETNLVAYYPFNQSSGSVLSDVTGNGHDGTLVNSPSWVSSSAFNTWLGLSNNQWETATNWSLGSVPAASDNVGVVNNGAVTPRVPYGSMGGNVTCNMLVIGTGATLNPFGDTPEPYFRFYGNYFTNGTSNNPLSPVFFAGAGNKSIGGTSASTMVSLRMNGSSGTTLWLEPEKKLTLTNTLTVDASTTFIIKSNATNTGSLLIGGSLTNNGTMHVQRYINGYSEYVSKPIHGWHFLGSPVGSFSISGSEFEPGTKDDLFVWSETEDIWKNYKAGAFTTIEPGTGYLLTDSVAKTALFTGTLNNSNLSVSGLTKTDGTIYSGWNLLGNPFPCSLQWGAGSWNLSNIDPGNCQIWNEVNASYTVISTGDFIPPTNGFMVHASATGASLTIPLNARGHSGTTWYKNTSSISSVNRFKLVATDPEQQTAQETIIAFDDQATSGYDPDFDSYFLTGYAPLFYSVSGGEEYALNTMPALTDDLRIPLTFISNGSTHYNIVLRDPESFSSALPIYLTDLKTGITQELRNNPSYEFYSDQGDLPDRFVLSFRSVGTETRTQPSPFAVWSTGQILQIINVSELRGDLSIINMTGQEVQRDELNGTKRQLIMTPLSSGIYIVRVKTGMTVWTCKILITP